MTSNATAREALHVDEPATNGTRQPNGYQQDTTLTDDAKHGAEKKEKKPSVVKRAWAKLGLDMGTLLMMGKAGLPPTIALAMYQADAVANQFTTLGYLAAIMSILGFCIMPRAKFIQTMTMNILGACVGCAIALLMTWTGIKARQHTTTPGAPPQRYNSSQSAVLAVWLFFQIYAVNALKAKFPQLALPTIIYAILVNVAATSGTIFSTTAQCKSFVLKLLEVYLTGFGIATGVSLFIIPVTCRKVVMKEATGYIGLLRGALGANKVYLYSLERDDMFEKTPVPDKKKKKVSGGNEENANPKIVTIKKMTSALQVLHGKLSADLPFAKREIAYGKLTPDDLEAMFKHLREILLPVLGFASVIDLFERAAEVNHWNGEGNEYDEKARKEAVEDWNELFQFVHEPLDAIFQALDDGLMHVLLRLGLEKPKKKKGKNQDDAEAKGDVIKPGDSGFAEHLRKQASMFFETKESTLRHWMVNKGIMGPEESFSESEALGEEALKKLASHTTRKRDQRQLFTLLYVIFLLNSVSHATLEFVKFADAHDQATSKSKLIWPGARRFSKWVKSVFTSQDSNQNDQMAAAGFDTMNTTVFMGDAYKHKRDPEHLAPVNAWEKFGNGIRALAHFFGSPESSFALRAACATMSVAIIAFLKDTQTFFIQQRLVWALIMVAISMTPTAGQAMFQFVLKIGGTVAAMIIAWLMWFIPGKHTAGVLVFVWVFVALGFYIPLKRLDLLIVGLISVVTATLIVGYELQVRKIGVQAATSTSGQPAYPITELGPYRLATVAGGILVSFFWTIFPYPITEHSALRQKLGGALYLSANLYSIMHEQVMATMRGDAGDDENDKKSPGYALLKARNKVFAKQMLMLEGLKMHADYVKWEFPLGGKFPAEEYRKVVGYLENIVNYTALIGYASQSFTHFSTNPFTQLAEPQTTPPPSSAQWYADFRRIVSTASITSHQITSLLSLLSSSITSAQPLPPYLHAPHGYQLAQKLAAIDHDILSLRHSAEPGYAAFAVMAVSTRCINMDVERLLVVVKRLVGELDFSWHVVSTMGDKGGEGESESESETLGERMERRRTGGGGKMD